MRHPLPDGLWEEQLLPRTRIHPISLTVPNGGQVFLKREDEAGYAVSGGKMRKFASLVPYWKSTGTKKVFVIGGSQSNQVLASAQILRQEGIDFQLVVKEGHFDGPGNSFLTEILVPSSEWIKVSSSNWPRVEQIASDLAQGASVPSYVQPEGAWCAEALPGTFSLARDIADQTAHGTTTPLPDHIFIEAGTALSAIGLLLALPTYLKPGQLPVVHILLMAMDETGFRERLEEAVDWAAAKLPNHFPTSLPSFHLHIPHNAKSFGSVNRTVLESIIRYARENGILTDPIYSGKLFYEAERIIKAAGLSGNILLIHSGGQSNLPGFYEKIKALL